MNPLGEDSFVLHKTTAPTQDVGQGLIRPKRCLVKVLIVCKDKGPSQMLVPLARLMRSRGDDVSLIIEGLASLEFEKADFVPYFAGPVNFQEAPYTLSVPLVSDILTKTLTPDVVVSAIGSPANIERLFSWQANALGIPLVFCEDFWGGHRRMDIIPKLVLVLDKYAQYLVERTHDHATKTVVVGNHGVQKGANPSQEAVDFFTELKSYDPEVAYRAIKELVGK